MLREEVLIIDDDTSSEFALRLMLEFEGFRVSFCENGPAVIQLLRKKRFDIILIDYRMAGMTGDQVTGLIRLSCSDAFIIGFSADSQEDAFIKAGANAFVSKHQLTEELIPLLNAKHASS